MSDSGDTSAFIKNGEWTLLGMLFFDGFWFILN